MIWMFILRGAREKANVERIAAYYYDTGRRRRITISSVRRHIPSIGKQIKGML